MAAHPPSDRTPQRSRHRSAAAGRTILVLAGGDPPHPALVLPAADQVVAADSGAETAAAHGRTVDVVVGDLDSIRADTLVGLRERGSRVEHHHQDKDATDLELALTLAAEEKPSGIILVGGHGGRLDHAFAVPGALAAVARPGCRVEAWLGPALVQVTVDEARVDARPGELVSLLAWGGPVHGVTTDGLRWPLSGATLQPRSTLGISNEATAPPARVTVADGTLLVVRPHALDPGADRRSPVPDRPAPQP